MAYTVEITKRAAKQIAKLPRDVASSVFAAIGTLAAEPRPQGNKKMKGHLDLYRIRLGDYRVVYKVEDQTVTVTVVAAGHRSAIYRGL